eukprot:3214781-Amphidinium_carterae.1
MEILECCEVHQHFGTVLQHCTDNLQVTNSTVVPALNMRLINFGQGHWRNAGSHGTAGLMMSAERRKRAHVGKPCK